MIGLSHEQVKNTRFILMSELCDCLTLWARKGRIHKERENLLFFVIIYYIYVVLVYISGPVRR